MKTTLTRRSFVKQSALAAGVFSAAPFNILNAANAGEKVRVAQIGCGGRGTSAHLPATKDEQLVAIVDVEENRHAVVKKWVQGKSADADHRRDRRKRTLTPDH